MQKKNTSRVSQIDNASEIVNTGLLLLVGFFAVLIRERFDLSLKLPGHHGVEFMILFMSGRMLTGKRSGMSIASLGASASAFLPIFHFGNAFAPLTLLLPGIIGDLVMNKLSRSSALIAGLSGGIAWAILPVTRQLISLATGIPFGSLVGGLVYPMAMHFLFGATGAFIGYWLSQKIRS